jgi:PadR family transcriptional regulator PadR
MRRLPVDTQQGIAYSSVVFQHKRRSVAADKDDKTDVLQGTLALMLLKTLEAMGPLHGYGIARRIEQMSGDAIRLNQGTLYPALVRLEQQGWIRAKWGTSDNNRRAKYYAITPRGERQLTAEEDRWGRVAAIVERFLKPAGDAS